jgi:hypothetical protein
LPRLLAADACDGLRCPSATHERCRATPIDVAIRSRGPSTPIFVDVPVATTVAPKRKRQSPRCGDSARRCFLRAADQAASLGAAKINGRGARPPR